MIQFVPAAVTKQDLLLRWAVVKCLEWLYQRYFKRVLDSGSQPLSPAGYALQMLYSIFPDGYYEFKSILTVMGPCYYHDAWGAK